MIWRPWPDAADTGQFLFFQEYEMNPARQNIIVGIFAMAGIAILCVLIMMFSDVLTWATRNAYPVLIKFDEGTTGVREGASVTFYGKRIGQTLSIDFINPNMPAHGVYVRIMVEGRYTLPQNARAEVLTSMMGFGRPALQIVVDDVVPVSETIARDGTGEIPGRIIPVLDQVVPKEFQQTVDTATARIGELAKELTPVANDLHNLITIRTMEQVDADPMQRVTANLYTAVQRLDQTLKAFNAVLADPKSQENLIASIDNLRHITDTSRVTAERLQRFSIEAEQFMGDARVVTARLNQTLDTIDSTVSSSGRKFATVADAAAQALREIDRSFALMNEGQGTAGLFLRDNRLYESMVLTAERLARAIEEFRDLLVLWKKGDIRVRVF
jgi:hypothetical protein